MRTKRILFIVIGLQLLALLLAAYRFLVAEVGANLPFQSWWNVEVTDLLIILALVSGSVASLAAVRATQARNDHVQEQLSMASGLFHEFVQKKFGVWELTASEAEVATLIIKGFSVAEIARLRGTSEGTVKAQSTAIYRKSGFSGRGQLVSHFLEELASGF